MKNNALLLAACLGTALLVHAQEPEAKPAPPDSGTTATAAGTAAPSLVATNGDRNLRLNFRGVPLDMVLNYLSDAAGFIIVLDTPVRGTVDVWSNQPLSKDEAVDLLNTVLARNGYAALRNGRTLKIVSRSDARTKDLPVKSGNDPAQIPKSDEMITQIIPVRHANATALTQNLQPLLPEYARDSFTANESGNALLLTATQADIRRMVEIVKALDDSISGISTIKVFALKFADAKELANAIKELFQPQASQQNQRGGRGGFNNPFFGGRGGGGPGGAPGGQASGRSGAANTQVTAVPDEYSNSLIVSAPEDAMPTIEQLVAEIDVPVADITELRVFHLQNADPLEMADIFYELFPDETREEQNNPQFRFRGGPFGQFNRNNQANASSDRTKKKGRVLAVPDQRTSSLIVSAASELMPQIEAMIQQLDASTARKQKVFVYSLENADVQQVEQVVRDMFERTTTGNRNANQNSTLGNRSLMNDQATPGTATGTGLNQQGGLNQGGGQLFR